MVYDSRNTVSVAGMELGVALSGAGPPLLVVGSSIYYPRTFSQRLRESYTLAFADLPHFVPLPLAFEPASISFDLYAACIEAVRVSTGFDRVVVVGHSHHGNVALEYAKRYPRRVSQVVLIGTPPVNLADTVAGSARYWNDHASSERKALLAARRSAVDDDRLASLPPQQGFVARYVADAPLYWFEPSYDAAWLWQDMRFEMPAVAAFRELYRRYRLTTGETGLPVLAVMGRYDYAVPHTLWQHVLPDLPEVTFHVFERSGHTPQLEEPDAFDGVLTAWLDGAQGRAP